MKNEKYYKQIKEALSEINREAQYVGEEGSMVTDCRTKNGALKRFRKLEKELVGNEEIKYEYIRTAYFHLATEISEEKRRGMNIEDDGWYIDVEAPSPVKVWYYSV